MPATPMLPLVIYVSGDGGMNEFSQSLCTAIRRNGYAVLPVDAKVYLKVRRTPQETTTYVTALIRKQQSGNSQPIILTGYSFGADVVPFVANRLPAGLQQRIRSLVLISPSETTVFEIGLMSGWFGNSWDVVKEIATVRHRTTIIWGADEDHFAERKLRPNRPQVLQVPGGHHFAYNVDAISKAVMRGF